MYVIKVILVLNFTSQKLIQNKENSEFYKNFHSYSLLPEKKMANRS